MVKVELIINIIIVCLITITFGYLLGMAVTRVVDRRLSEISITMPKITIPSPYDTTMDNKGKVSNIYEHFEQENETDDLVNPKHHETSLKQYNLPSIENKTNIYDNEKNKCYCVGGYGTTYYKNPNNMTPNQIQKFKTKAKFSNMTLQDYINWLLLFDNEPEKLSINHARNLQKITKGLSLSFKDLPTADIEPNDGQF